MNNQNNTPKPLFRVSFSRITGHDSHGKEQLSYPREIGAIWPRKGDKAGGTLQLDIIPIELTQRQGVIFVTPVDDAPHGGTR